MLVGEVLLVLAACALGGAALRVAALVSDGGGLVEEVLVAAPIVAAFAVCWTLLIGFAGLSGSAVALAAGPVIAWLAGWRWLPAGSFWRRIEGCWTGWTRAQRALALALVGLAAGLAFEIAYEPGFGNDALNYHLADALGWIRSGHAGAVQTFSYDLPYGYYPITGELLFTWVIGISRTFAPIALCSPLILGVTLLGLWRVLEVLRVPRLVAIAGVASFGTLPLVAQTLNQSAPGTDLLAVTWLSCTAALCVRAQARPVLLGPALLAAGLGAGTKTTVIPLELVCLIAGAWRARSQLRGARASLLAGAAGAIAVGTPWYLRDWFVHGWPLWPFSVGPTGDPQPHFMSLFNESFLDSPRRAVSLLGNLYAKWTAGGLVLIGGLAAIPLVARTRAALLFAACAVGALLVWASAPFTGLSKVPLLDVIALDTIRYILPSLGACIVALAVAARDASAPGRGLVVALFGAACVYSLAEWIVTGFPLGPHLQYLAAGAAIGALAGVAAPRMSWGRPVGAAAVVLVIVFLALSAPGWLGREASDKSYDAPVLAAMVRLPGWSSGRQPISFAPYTIASLAGPQFRHPLELIPANEPCARVRARARRGWIVLVLNESIKGLTAPYDTPGCLIGQPFVDAGGDALIFGPST
jgi:hypothetical protein